MCVCVCVCVCVANSKYSLNILFFETTDQNRNYLYIMVNSYLV